MSDITSPMSSETFQMGDVVGEVQYVSPDDPNAKSAAEFAVSEQQVVLEGIISGYKITFSNELVKYDLVILAKDRNGDSKLFFTVVKGNDDVLLFTHVNLSTWELFPPNTDTADGKVLLGVDNNAIKAAKFAAAQNRVEFMGPCSGFEIVFPPPAINYPTFYHLMFKGKDSTGCELKFFTIVETICTKPTHLVLLFTHVKPSSCTRGDGNEPVDGKVLLIDPNQYYATTAGEFAATKNGMKFKENTLAILIFSPALPSEQYYHLILLAEEDNGDSQLYFTIVFVNYDTPDAVLLYKPVNL